jgi:hypothetical protein
MNRIKSTYTVNIDGSFSGGNLLVFTVMLVILFAAIGVIAMLPHSSHIPSAGSNNTTVLHNSGSTTTQETTATHSIVLVNGTGWTSNELMGSIPVAGSCKYLVGSNGYYLPDPSCTPGSINTQVTQANIFTTICRPGGYTSSVRPPESLTEPAKFKMMAAYGSTYSASSIEFDHLIPLSLGGSSDIANLWPQPNQGSPALFDPTNPYGINAKDGVEDALHTAVCRQQVTLASAQLAIATNWVTALTVLHINN